jgi:nucleotide-binding universal stress UspA family protein
MAAAEQAKSDAAAEAIAAAAREACTRQGVAHEIVVERGMVSDVPYIAVEYARVRDLTLVPLDGDAGLQRFVAEAIVFGSGRPVMVLPAGVPAPATIGAALVAWDYSRAAARAVADALPLLKTARDVRVLTIVNEKDLGTRRSGAELARHLAHHDVRARLEDVDAAGRAAADVIEAAARSEPTDLLVIGAFGHSRLRDFVLGGVTKAMLAAPPVPLLLTH